MEKILSHTVKKQNTSLMLISGMVLIFHFLAFKFMMQLNSKYDLLELSMPAMQIEFLQQSAKSDNKPAQVIHTKNIQKVVLPPKIIEKQPEIIKKIEQKPIPKVENLNIERKSILTARSDVKTMNIIEQQHTAPMEKTIKVPDTLPEVKEMDKQVIKPSDNIQTNKNEAKIPVNSGKNSSTDAKDSSSKTNDNHDSQYLGGKPQYPEYAQENNIEGTVILNVLVGTDGKAKKVVLNKSSGESILDNAALKHVQSAGNKFKPMIKDGNAVETWITFAIKFKLD